MTQLLPCPFCGGEPAYYASKQAVFRAEWVAHVYHCTKCQARVQNTDRMMAQTMWNTRAGDTRCDTQSDILKRARRHINAALSLDEDNRLALAVQGLALIREIDSAVSREDQGGGA